MEPVVEVGKDKIYPLVFTPEAINTFWERASKFPTLYGHQIIGNIDAFVDMFFDRDVYGTLHSKGLFWVLNPEQFTGVFYLDNIIQEDSKLKEAHIHYTFFDRRHNGRVPLVRAMMKYVFEKYQFQRLNADIPNYNTSQARHFATECGLSFEGKRRKSAFYKGEWFDTNLYGILKSEVLNVRQRVAASD